MGEQWSSDSHFKHTVRGWIPSDLKEEDQTSHRDGNTLAQAEGLLFLHDLESNPGSSLQTEEEAGLP